MVAMRTRRLLALALVLTAAGCRAPRPHTDTGDTVLSVQGRVVGGAARFGKDDLAQLPRQALRGTDPRGGAEASFTGIALQKLLGEALELDRGADLVVVSGKDGYEMAIPLSVLRQHRPVLADTVDGVPLAQARPASAPLLLAWPTADSPGLATDPRARWWWVDGVTKLEVRSWLGTYGRALRVPPGAAGEARPGADAFQSDCIMCHRVRGTGGRRGPELTERLAAPEAQEAFAAAIRSHARLPEAAPVAETSPAAVRAIGSFLRAVAISGAGLPQDEPPQEPMGNQQAPPGSVGPTRPPGM